jgi:sugar fermentation stimulation protein A
MLNTCYSIIIYIPHSLNLSIGSLGMHSLSSGYYVYTGRDKRNVVKRIERHYKKEKKFRWHIDYLTGHKDTIVLESICYSVEAEKECEINKAIQSLPDARSFIPGFGSSDCMKCPSHLVYFEEFPDLKKIQYSLFA